MKFQILVNVKVEQTQNADFKLELQFELSVTIQLRQSVSSKTGSFQVTLSRYWISQRTYSSETTNIWNITEN